MITIKAKCEVTKHHFICRVFNTKKEMYAYYIAYITNSKYDERYGNFKRLSSQLNFSAICMPYEKLNFKKGKKPKRADDMGEILFYKGRLGTGIIAHEMGHAAMWWARLIDKNTNAEFGPEIGNKEEKMLTVLYHLARNFTNRAYKLGVF